MDYDEKHSLSRLRPGSRRGFSVEGSGKALALLRGVKLGPGMLLAAQVEGQSVDVNDPLFVVVHRAVHPDAGGVESPAGVEVVQGMLVFGTSVRPDRQGRPISQVKLLFVPLDVVELVSFFALNGGCLRSCFPRGVV